MKRNTFIAILPLLALSFGAQGERALAQQRASQSNDENRAARSTTALQLSNLLAQARPKRRPFFSLMPESGNAILTGPRFSITPAAGPPPPVTGSGTVGRLTKFTGGSSVIGDSTIYEDKFGKVGVGTDSPGSRLTVAGMIEAKGADGGIKFPDGSVQTTSASSALRGVVHDQTLMGGGTAASPLGVASPLMVRDLDNPARQPVTFLKTSVDEDPFTVPAGKLLVIEFISGTIRVVDGDELRDSKVFPITITEAGQSSGNLHFIVGNAIDVSFGSRTFGISQTLRLYAGPGSVVKVFSPSSSAPFSRLSVSGYFVDVGDATPVSSRFK